LTDDRIFKNNFLTDDRIFKNNFLTDVRIFFTDVRQEEVDGGEGQGPGADFTKLHFGRKTFWINFQPQI
jgi:hypothetical protein